jgi:carbon storage regulator
VNPRENSISSLGKESLEMLVLSRKIGQRIVLPDSDASIIVLAVSGKRVRLGIEAPSDTTVHRGEVWERILDLGELNSSRAAQRQGRGASRPAAAVPGLSEVPVSA